MKVVLNAYPRRPFSIKFPQGSTLDLMLFFIFFNDISDVISSRLALLMHETLYWIMLRTHSMHTVCIFQSIEIITEKRNVNQANI